MKKSENKTNRLHWPKNPFSRADKVFQDQYMDTVAAQSKAIEKEYHKLPKKEQTAENLESLVKQSAEKTLVTTIDNLKGLSLTDKNNFKDECKQVLYGNPEKMHKLLESATGKKISTTFKGLQYSMDRGDQKHFTKGYEKALFWIAALLTAFISIPVILVVNHYRDQAKHDKMVLGALTTMESNLVVVAISALDEAGNEKGGNVAERRYESGKIKNTLEKKLEATQGQSIS